MPLRNVAAIPAPRCTPLPAYGLAALLLLLAPGLSGCGYPEAGFYELLLYAPEGQDTSSSADESAGPALEARIPFMVEELTDDTDLTIGFVLLLPREGELVRVPVQNSADTSRRGWQLAVASADSGAGDLELAFDHYGEKLNISGRYRPLQEAAVQGFSGSMPDEGLMLLAAPIAAQISGRLRLCAMAEVQRSTQREFEAVLGGKLGSAARRDAAALAPLPEAPAQAAATTEQEKKPKRQRPLGGRGGGGR